MGGITIYDIADRANVSIATVSRAFNDSPRVSALTRDRIFAIAREMGYQPHASARSLAKRQSHLISAVIPMLTSYFYLEVLHGVQDRIAGSDFDLLVYSAPCIQDVDDLLDNALNRGRAAGMLLFSSPLNAHRLERLHKSRQPVVLVDLRYEHFDSVSIDNEEGGYIATRHLLDQGYRRIGLILAHPESIPSQQRADGYRRAHRETGAAIDPQRIVSSNDSYFHGYTEEAGYALMKQLLHLEEPPDSVFAVSDIQALGAQRAVEEYGLDVPGDIALVGFDDIMISRYVGLTTLRQPMYEMGQAAIDRLLNRILNPTVPVSHIVFSPTLIERQTSHSIA